MSYAYVLRVYPSNMAAVYYETRVRSRDRSYLLYMCSDQNVIVVYIVYWGQSLNMYPVFWLASRPKLDIVDDHGEISNEREYLQSIRF